MSDTRRHFVSDAVGYQTFHRMPEPSGLYAAHRYGNEACAAMPAPPASVDYAANAGGPLSNVLGNSDHGCCFVAMGGHAVTLWSANNGGPTFVPTLSEVLADYSAISGYNGTPQSDTGCDPFRGFAYWQQSGMFGQGGHPLTFAGFGQVDGRNLPLIRQVIHEFECVGICMGLPDAWIDPRQHGPNGNDFIWPIAGPPNPANGHAFLGIGYDSLRFSWRGVHIDTWGLQGTIPWDAVAYYFTSAASTLLFAMAAPMIAHQVTGLTPAGRDWPTLVSFANSLGANIPPPPAPAPTPKPSPRVFTVCPDTMTVSVPPGSTVIRKDNLGGAVVVATKANAVQMTPAWSVVVE